MSPNDDKDDDDIEVTDTVSPSERIRRKFQNAQENGNVICLGPDGDKEERDPNVKLEPIVDGKRLDQDAKRESKRMRREQQEDSQASVQSVHATFTSSQFMQPSPQDLPDQP